MLGSKDAGRKDIYFMCERNVIWDFCPWHCKNTQEGIMQLTPRAEKIIRILVRFPADNPVTIGIISEELGISDRSVQRELPTVEKWLLSNGFHFTRKRSVGLILDEPAKRREELLALLEKNNYKVLPGENRKDRQTLLCRELLFSEEPLKAFYFTETFGISEGTLFSSLHELSKWFRKYQLTVVRRPGLGIFIEGTEISRRQAATSFLSRQAREDSILGQLGKNRLPDEKKELVWGIDTDILFSVNEILADCEEQLRLQFSDNGYLQVLVYISFSIQRMKANHFIMEKAQEFSEISIEPEYAVAEYLMRQLRQHFHLSVSVDETVYLATYLSGLHIWPNSQKDLTELRNLDIHQITLAIIRRVSEILNINFSNDDRLLRELSTHIQPTIARLRAGIPVENPLLDSFQNNHPAVFRACEEGASILCSKLNVETISASEVGYITLYFVMAKERIEKLSRQISVILVCPTGIGSSRLLDSSLRKVYPDLDIRGITSAFEIDSEKLKSDGIDLIISTVKLSISYRYLQVNPILTKQDKMLLDSKFKMLRQQKMSQSSTETAAPVIAPVCREDVEYISALGTEIYRLLQNIRIGQAPVLRTRNEVISCGAALFADSPEMEQHFYEVFKSRDDLANTYIKSFHALLLHGRSPHISQAYFGYIRLEPPVYEKAQIIVGAIVSIIPSDKDNHTAAPVASEIVGALMEEPSLLKAMQSMKEEAFTDMLEQILLRFYRNSVRNKLHLKEALLPEKS